MNTCDSHSFLSFAIQSEKFRQIKPELRILLWTYDLHKFQTVPTFHQIPKSWMKF